MIKCQNLVCGYNHNVKVNRLNLEILKGKVTVIIGPNGSGKSTLLKTMAGLLVPIEGNIELNHQNINLYTPKQRAKYCSFLPQTRPLPSISVQSLIAHGRFPYLGFSRQMSALDKTFVESSIQQLQLEKYRHTNLQQLSGGEQQKAYLGMMMAQNSELLLLDEPTTYLDIQHQFSILKDICDYSKKGKTLIIVLHDITQALRYGDQILLMDQGNILFQGNKKELINTGLIEKVFQVQIKTFVENEEETYFIIPK